MSASQLEQLRQQLKENSTTSAPTRSGTGGGDNALFRFWDAKVGETSTVRFLGDGTDEDNLFFWVERRVINLQFDGIIGRADYAGKDVTVSVPCMKMYGRENRCPILEETNKYWKTNLEEVARRYWPKRTYLMQGFVRQIPDWIPGKEDKAPENPIRRFSINQSLFKIMEQQIFDPDMVNMPNHYENGTDFRFIKTSQGEFANYQSSSFARRESSLTDQEREAIDKYGLFDLRQFRPARPSEEGIAVIEEMFRASLEGLPYDPQWAEFYRPFGVDIDQGSRSQVQVPSTPTPAPSATPTQSATQSTTVETPSVADSTPTDSTPAASSSATDALARLRSEVAKHKG